MAATDGEGEVSSSFRWADAARYAVASVVTILIVAVVVKAVMVLRPKPPYLLVSGGSVFVTPSASQREEMFFTFFLDAQNPSGGVQMYYTGITAYIFRKNTSSSSSSSKPSYDSMFNFTVRDMSFSQNEEQSLVLSTKLRRGRSVESSDFDGLYEGSKSIVTDLTLRLDGTLITQPMPWVNTTGRGTSFYCRPLLASVNENQGFGVPLYKKDDAFCVSGGTPRRAKA